ncbi:MAG: hypothetical protein IJO48_02715 [Clostridia bacterium]|nr:hypothetical protein [Clostridia bacterium]
MDNKKKDLLFQELADAGINSDEEVLDTADTETSSESEEKAPGAIPDEIALEIGRAVIEQLTASGELDAEAAAELLMESAPDRSNAGLAALSAKAANELVRLKEAGKLNGNIDDYVADPEFVKLLYDMPTRAAVRIYDLQKQASKSGMSDADAVAKAEQSIIEKLLARKALPKSTKSSVAASPEVDYSNMSSEQFRELSKRVKKAASDGMKVRI